MLRRLTLAVLLAVLPALAPASDVSTQPRTTDHGPEALRAGALAPTPAAEPDESAPGGDRESLLLWDHHYDDPIYTSCGIAAYGGPVFAGTFLNPPMQAEARDLLTGAPLWASAGTEFYVDACRTGFVLAAVDFNNADSTAVISEWRPGSATPLWSYTVHPCRSLIYEGWASRKPVQVADTGGMIAVALVMYTEAGQEGRLFAFEPGNGTPVVDWPFPSGNVVATALSEDGRYCAMTGWPTVYVYDIVADALRWSGPAGAGNDALAISPNGDYLAWGWSTLNVRHWNGSTYGAHYSATPGGGLYVGQVAFAPGDAFAVAWDNGNTTPNQVFVETYTLATPNLIWHYDYQGEPVSTHVDIPSTMLYSPSGAFLVVGSWGGSFPELHVFRVNNPDPVLTVDTPGSIFDMDVVDHEGAALVVACGKSVHAGTSGRGGDLYAIEASNLTATNPPPGADRLRLSAAPNPFNPTTNFRVTLPAPGRWTLAVYDPAGRRVHEVAGEGAGDLTIPWDATGHASGVYLARLEAGGQVATTSISLLK